MFIYIYIYICRLHVNGSYWQTGWESPILDLDYTLILLNQQGLQAAYKLLVYLSSSSVELLSQYKPFVLMNIC